MRHAFSLLELLVVVAIIAVLAGLMLPAVGLVRQAALGVACQSNLRNVGMAAAAYAGDHDGAICPVQIKDSATDANTQFWTYTLLPWIDQRASFAEASILRCPARRGLEFAYAMNWEAGQLGALATKPWAGHLARAAHPATTFYLADSNPTATPDKWQWTMQDCNPWMMAQVAPRVMATRRHSGGANVLFLDQHLETTRIADTITGGAATAAWKASWSIAP